MRLRARDIDTGAEHTLFSNRVHPFWVAGAAAEVRLVANGHAVRVPGSNTSGRWVEAQALAPGDRLLDDDGSYSTVVARDIAPEQLEAYNITVGDFHTFFVAGADNDNAPAVWVHNTCSFLPAGQRQLVLDALERIQGGNVRGMNPHLYDNQEGFLRETMDNGKLIEYTTHYVGDEANRFRIITGTDGSRWFSGSHYENKPHMIRHGKP